MSTIEWAAGYFDGEGCVIYDVNPERGNVQHKLTVGCSSLDALEELQGLLGGAVIKLSEKWKINLQQYVWYTTTDIALSAAQKLIPHSVVKRAELELFVMAMLTESRILRGMSEEQKAIEIASRRLFHDRLKQLRSYNKRGVGHTALAYAQETNRINSELALASDEPDESPSQAEPLSQDPSSRPRIDPFKWINK